MCGICGYTGDGTPDLLDRMLNQLIHRGPDEEGRYREEGVGLGIRRLRVIDPAGSRQPVANESGTVRAVLNGEIYNYRELRKELVRKGHRFASHGDTEILVHLYEEEGEAAVSRLRGMFAYALWDRERETLWLVRDRLGIKPLYYAIRPDGQGEHGGVIFASELPALLAGVPKRAIRPQAIADYLTCLYVPGPETMFQGVYQLRPGELLKIRGSRVEFQRYYQPAQAVPRFRWSSEAEAADYFLGLLRDTVRAHLVSDVPLGLFLSGGLDSGAILTFMRETTNGTIRTFTIGYESPADRSYNELDAARLLATHFGAQHTEAILRPDAVSLLPQLVAAMGEPFADSSAVPTYLVSKVAKRSVTVVLSGIGGDELFGGYPRYLGLRLASFYGRLPVSVRSWAAAQAASWLTEGTDGQDDRGRLKRFLVDGHRPLDDQYLRWITFLPPEWGASAFAPELRDAAEGAGLERAYRALFNRWPSPEPADRAMGLDLQTYLPDDLLRMGDRMSMAHSLELRVPFCDHHLLAFALAVPATMRLSGWRPKGFMRRALASVLPRPVLSGAKRGFRVPMARWLREELREMVHDLLSDEAVRRRGYVRPEYVRWLIREHEAGRRNFADQLFALLVLELWCQNQASTA
ncbi:MAG TPA: asparagine synthase (glutamine-hydrolyzing) [Nitrospiraceae bacterium]|jgi:asparagine synthase (glutamine-hydrolysing)|nr:asparagine synthase (glutamine-hydrolyzing) [Nitrospiraceae bacterium]